MRRLLQLSLIGVAVGLLSACTSAPKEATDREAETEESEYTYYTPTGSNIPVRIRKSDAKPTPEETAQSQAVLEEWQRRSRGVPPRP